MEKNLEILDRLYNLRYRSGKVHLFHSINKLVGRFGNVVSLDKIYVSKEYLSYLSEKLFQDKNRLISFFGGNNKFVRLSLVHEFMQDFGRDIAQDIKDDFMELKQYNSSVFKEVKERMIILKENENEDHSRDNHPQEKPLVLRKPRFTFLFLIVRFCSCHFHIQPLAFS